MAKRPKPKWGFTGIADARSFEFSEKDRRTIISAIESNRNEYTQGLVLHYAPIFIKNLEHQVMVSRYAIELERNTPTTLEIREALIQTQASLRDLRKKLSGLDSESRRLLRDGLHGTLAEPPAVIDLLDSLEAQHERLQNAIDLAAKKASALKSPQSGPKSSKWLRHFEDYLANSFETNLGIPASKNRDGVFSKILAVCLKHIETPLRKNPSHTRTPKATFVRIRKIINRTR